MKKRSEVIVLGSTGSVGKNALEVLQKLDARFKVIGLSASSNVELLKKQIAIVKPRWVCIRDENLFSRHEAEIGKMGVSVYGGLDGMCRLASKRSDAVIVAVSGIEAVKPIMAAAAFTKRVCIANKEAIVSAGEIIVRTLRENGVELIPIDSEHSAVFQSLKSRPEAGFDTIYLTGSGGPLKDVPAGEFKSLSVERVISHPRWNMGRKISVDSATLMNKGLEVIEARWLFDADIDKIKVVIHPEAIIHSMVEFKDGSIIAQLSVADMKIPIQYALTYPDIPDISYGRVDFFREKRFTFERPDTGKFPLLDLSYETVRRGGNMPAALNAVNDRVVSAYLKNRLKFSDIMKAVPAALKSVNLVKRPSLEDIIDTHREGIIKADEQINRYRG